MHLEPLKIGSTGAYATRLVPGPMVAESDRLQSLAAHLATKSEAVQRVPPSEMPSSFHLGMPLKWDSSHVAVDLYVELPFWLLIPSASSFYTVSVEATSIEIEVCQELYEISTGHQSRSSHSSFLAYDRITETTQADLDQRIQQAAGAITYRALKTVLCIRTQALNDAVVAYTEANTQRRQHGFVYLQTLAYAHIPILNRLINAYQRISEDPFAHEVADWELPFWVLRAKDKWLGIPVIPYLTYDQYPYICDFPGNRTAIALATEQQVKDSLVGEPIPGHIELIEAWGLYYRGQYGDAIRLLATSIEISLEYVFKKLLQQKGHSRDQIESRLEETFNDFESRLNDYLNMARRRLPGPILSVIPYINGVRYKQELDRNRKLRHKVVHEGLRFDKKMAGSIQRAMETTTWLFRWLNESAGRPLGQIPGKGIYGALNGRPAFRWNYTASGVIIQNPQQELAKKEVKGENTVDLISDNMLHEQFMKSIDGDSRDLELCVRMFFEVIKSRLHDSPPVPSGQICEFERFIIPMESRLSDIPVFLFDLEGLPRVEQLHSVAARLIERSDEGQNGSRALCIFNYQNGAPWRLREQEFLGQASLVLARKCKITILSTVDMLLTVDAARRYSWRTSRIYDATFQLGQSLQSPPFYRKVGSVRTFYADPRVLSINVNAGAELRKGDTIVIRLKDRYHEQVVGSLQQDRADVAVVVGPARAGVLVPLDRSVVLEGGGVFFDPEKRPLL
jgi:hypothetical protein